MNATSKSRGHPSLKIPDWPAADRTNWEVALRPAGFLSKGGWATRWRPATQYKTWRGYGRWLAWLAAQDVVLADEAPGKRITPDRVEAYVAYLRHRCAPVTVADCVAMLCMAQPALFPLGECAWLREMERHLKRHAVPVRDKFERLVPAHDLVRLGLDLIESAATRLNLPVGADVTPRARVAAARDFRDGLMIAFLALRPVRVANMLGIDIGAQLLRSRHGASLQFVVHETKTKRRLELSWPIELLPALDRYLHEVRGVLISAKVAIDASRPPRPPGHRLWLGQGGTPLTLAGLDKLLERHTTRRFGFHVNAQRFRRCAATTIATEAPDLIRAASHLLGHTNMHTTEKSYIAVTTRNAVQSQSALIASIRKEFASRRQKKARSKCSSPIG